MVTVRGAGLRNDVRLALLLLSFTWSQHLVLDAFLCSST